MKSGFILPDNKYAPLKIQLAQAPCLFSVSVLVENNNFGKYLDEYPLQILMKLGALGLPSSDIQIHKWENGSGIMIYAN